MERTLDLKYDDIEVTLERATLADARVRRELTQDWRGEKQSLELEEVTFLFFITQLVKTSLPLQKIAINPGRAETQRQYEEWLKYFDDEVLVSELWNAINGPLRAIPGQKKASEAPSSATSEAGGTLTQ